MKLLEAVKLEMEVISVSSFMPVIQIWPSLKDFLTIAMKSVAFCLEPIYREILLGE